MTNIQFADMRTAFSCAFVTSTTILIKTGLSDLLETVFLAVLGAVVSFGMSVFLKWLYKKVK